MLTNYHTHTPRCMHATGSEEDYVRAALEEGFSVLGFSDHSPWPFRSGHISRCRMLPRQLPDYVESIHALQKKYDGKLRIFTGLEAEYFPDYMGWLAEQKEKCALDYLILGNHFERSEECGGYFGVSTTPRELRAYAELTIQGMETGLYAYLAHPDLFLNLYPAFDEEAEAVSRALCEAAAELDMPLEYNLLGLLRGRRPGEGLGYTTDEFWQIAAEYPVKAIFGFDAHAPAELRYTDKAAAARKKLEALGITVLDALPGLM